MVYLVWTQLALYTKENHIRPLTLYQIKFNSRLINSCVIHKELIYHEMFLQDTRKRKMKQGHEQAIHSKGNPKDHKT